MVAWDYKYVYVIFLFFQGASQECVYGYANILIPILGGIRLPFLGAETSLQK